MPHPPAHKSHQANGHQGHLYYKDKATPLS